MMNLAMVGVMNLAMEKAGCLCLGGCPTHPENPPGVQMAYWLGSGTWLGSRVGMMVLAVEKVISAAVHVGRLVASSAVPGLPRGLAAGRCLKTLGGPIFYSQAVGIDILSRSASRRWRRLGGQPGEGSLRSCGPLCS